MMKVCLPHDCAQWKFRKIINGHKPKEKKIENVPLTFFLWLVIFHLLSSDNKHDQRLGSP